MVQFLDTSEFSHFVNSIKIQLYTSDCIYASASQATHHVMNTIAIFVLGDPPFLQFISARHISRRLSPGRPRLQTYTCCVISVSPITFACGVKSVSPITFACGVKKSAVVCNFHVLLLRLPLFVPCWYCNVKFTSHNIYAIKIHAFKSFKQRLTHRDMDVSLSLFVWEFFTCSIYSSQGFLRSLIRMRSNFLEKIRRILGKKSQ